MSRDRNLAEKDTDLLPRDLLLLLFSTSSFHFVPVEFIFMAS